MHDAKINFIGRVLSPLKDLRLCPSQGSEGGVQAFLHIFHDYLDALLGVKPGSWVVLLTWLDQASRSVLQVYPRGDRNRPLTGVFLTRSPARPNPIGLHAVQVIAVHEDGITVAPLEALDMTPIVDIKIGSAPDLPGHN